MLEQILADHAIYDDNGARIGYDDLSGIQTELLKESMPTMSTYEVTLVMKVEAEDLGDAARAFVDHLVDKGMRDWRYQVFDHTSGAEGVYNGWGDIQPYRLSPDDASGIDPADTSDEALLRTAQALNES